MESKLVLVTLLSMGKTFYFKSEDESLLIDDLVICETTRGIELGKISGEFITREISEEDQYPVIIRKGNEEDYLIHEANLVLANEAITLTQAKSDLLKLEMNVVACEYMFDRTKVIIYYLAETRVDFRDLLKELANDLHCRIELRQIGARDKAKMIGGIGICGLKLCCTTFLNEFDGISITMAKNQMLALNIPKLSGQCGKLMCCLKYENDTYTEIQKALPRVGSKAKYNGQVYKITSINIITKVCRLENHDGIVNVDYKDIKDHLLPRETPVSGGKNDN